MKKTLRDIKTINSVSELHHILNLPKPLHPLVTLINHSDDSGVPVNYNNKLIFNFYNITIKRSFKGQMKYGKNHYDFDEGTMSFLSPNQVIVVDESQSRNRDGWSLLFHPDLIRNYPLGKSIRNYGFFSYEVHEALHLSESEEKQIEQLIKNIEIECQARMDAFSSDVIVSNLELLLNYCNRFYNRQFTTRKTTNSDLLSKFETILSKHFSADKIVTLPTVNSMAAQMNLSPGYLSDMLRHATGLNTQQHIHAKVIEEIKHLLTATNLSVSEIAFRLGFEYPQSLNKLFRNKTNMSPLEYRTSFN